MEEFKLNNPHGLAELMQQRFLTQLSTLHGSDGTYYLLREDTKPVLYRDFLVVYKHYGLWRDEMRWRFTRITHLKNDTADHDKLPLPCPWQEAAVEKP